MRSTFERATNSRRRTFRTAPLEAGRKINSWALEAEDAIFKRITYADALAGYLQSNGVTAEQMRNNTVDAQILSRARDYAGREALKAALSGIARWYRVPVVHNSPAP